MYAKGASLGDSLGWGRHRQLQIHHANGPHRAIDGIRVLLKTRATALKSRTAAITQIIHFLTTAPAEVREKYAAMKDTDLHVTLARSRPPADDVLGIALRRLARRIMFLTIEIDDAYDQLAALTKEVEYSLHWVQRSRVRGPAG